MQTTIVVAYPGTMPSCLSRKCSADVFIRHNVRDISFTLHFQGTLFAPDSLFAPESNELDRPSGEGHASAKNILALDCQHYCAKGEEAALSNHLQ